MAETNPESINLAGLHAQLERTEKLAGELASGSGRQKQMLDALAARAEEIRGSVSRAVEAASAHAALLESLRARAQTVTKQIEEDTRKANSESGFAFNAKGNAEEHAKAIAQIHGTVEATFTGLTATKAATDALGTAIAASKAAADLDMKAIGEVKVSATRDAAQMIAASERVAAVMPSIEQGSKDANAITAAKTGAEASAASIAALNTQMGEVSAKAASDGATIAKAEEESKKLVASMTDARTKANETNARLGKYEEDIKGMGEAHAAMLDKLEGLLPHATSAGLASAFHSQKARFSKPQPYWLGLFVVAIAGLLYAAGMGLPSAGDSWDAILRHFVNRLPVVAPLVWLAIYAGHHYSMALRMEEDYAFKEAVSTAFEGYKREMLAIPATPGSDVSPLVRLCESVLGALAERPGRIYDGKTEVITPLTPAFTAIRDSLSELAKFVKAKEPKS